LRVLSSRYCRTLDTAHIALGDTAVEPLPALDRFSLNELVNKALGEVIGLAQSFTVSWKLVKVAPSC
jgi:hypothetical protein